MDVVERTATRVVVEERAPGTARAAMGIAAVGAIAAAAQLVLTGNWIYLVVLAAAGGFIAFGLRRSKGVRTTLDAGSGIARWERLGGLLPARREASLAEVRGIVFVPASDDGPPAYDPVLTVGGKRWRLATRSITDADPVRQAISEVLDLAKGRRLS